MSDFFDAIVAWPTVVFTVLVGVSFGFWLVSTLIGFGLDTLDLDADGDLDADSGSFGSFLDVFGLAGVPIVFTLSIASLFAWITSLVIMEIIGSRTTWVLVALGAIVFVGSLLVGLLLAGLVAKPLAPLFVTEPAQKRADFVGRTCVVRTEKVTDAFGQAEVTDSEGATLLVQVRCDEPNDFGSGDEAIIFALDDEAETFQITREPDLV
ncbi:MAG: hypothetical protein AAGA37_12300 [Actinomycetota bacterium]